MKTKTLAMTIAVVLMTYTAHADGRNYESLGFVAPQISGKGNVYNPESGEIIYDASDSTFYGRNHSSAWVSLGGPSNVVAVGTVITFAASTCPSGYLASDGSAVSRSTYSGLYTVIGVTHGSGDGASTFNVPDYRGRFLRGIDGSAGNDPDKTTRTAMATGGNTGNNIGSVQTDAFKSHTHTQDPHNHSMSGSNFAGGVGNTAARADGSGVSSNTSSTTATNQNTGGSETRPVNAYVNFCIKY